MSQYDKDLKEGDLVTTYHTGIWRVTKVEERFREGDYPHLGQKKGDQYSSLIHYEKVLNGKHKPAKGNSRCDAAFCAKLTRESIEKECKAMIEEAEEKANTLLELIEQSGVK
tara:strand:- start:165 stop:500 length:336 start_codon:yes stop_codon:yes gene_type:complete